MDENDFPLATVGIPIHKATDEPGRIRSFCGAAGYNLAEQWENVTCEECENRRGAISKVEAREIAHLAELESPEHGHTFEITVRSRGSHKVVGDPVHTDAQDFLGEPWTFRVRAWSLKKAFERAAHLPMTIWSGRLNIDHGKEETRDPIAVLCTHEGEPQILQARFGCAEDEPLYPGDRVHRVTTISGIIVAGQAIRANDDEAWIERAPSSGHADVGEIRKSVSARGAQPTQETPTQ